MPTPDDIYSGINERMQSAMEALRNPVKQGAAKTKETLGGSFDPLGRTAAGVNPVTSIMSIGQQVIPAIGKGINNVGGALNKSGVKEWANDPAVNALAGSSPLTAPLAVGAQGARFINNQINKAGSAKTPVKPPSYGEGAQNIRAGRSPDRNPPASTKQETPTENPERPSQATGGQETSALTGGRGDTRTNSNGVTQTGTQTSLSPMTMDDANKLLSGGYKINTRYAGNQLPYTESSPYAGKSNAEIYNPETLHQHDSDVDYVSLSKDIYKDQSGVELSTRNGGMKADYKQMDVNPGESVPEEKVNWANRTMADNSDEKTRRRSAFLDAKGSMQGLRDSEAVQGISYRGGNHYIADGKGGDSLTKVENKDDMRTYKSGEEGARQIRDKYVNALTSKGDSVEYQTDAPAPLPDAVPGNTDIDKSQLDTSDLMDMNPSESIIGNNTPSRTVKKGTLFNR